MDKETQYKIDLFVINVGCDKDGLYDGPEWHQINEVETISASSIKGVMDILKSKYNKHDDISEDEEELYWDSTVEEYRDDDDEIAYYSSELRARLYKEETTQLKMTFNEGA